MAKQAFIENTASLKEIRSRPIDVKLPIRVENLGVAMPWLLRQRFPLQFNPVCEIQYITFSHLPAFNAVVRDVHITLDDVKNESLWKSKGEDSLTVGLARRIKEYPSGRVVLFRDSTNVVAGVCWVQEEPSNNVSIFFLLVPFGDRMVLLGGRIRVLHVANVANRLLECIVAIPIKDTEQSDKQ